MRPPAIGRRTTTGLGVCLLASAVFPGVVTAQSNLSGSFRVPSSGSFQGRTTIMTLTSPSVVLESKRPYARVVRDGLSSLSPEITYDGPQVQVFRGSRQLWLDICEGAAVQHLVKQDQSCVTLGQGIRVDRVIKHTRNVETLSSGVPGEDFFEPGKPYILIWRDLRDRRVVGASSPFTLGR
jgi:hypothetical protein